MGMVVKCVRSREDWCDYGTPVKYQIVKCLTTSIGIDNEQTLGNCDNYFNYLLIFHVLVALWDFQPVISKLTNQRYDLCVRSSCYWEVHRNRRKRKRTDPERTCRLVQIKIR